ncbi:hypothetical protein INR49_001581 [Caranx melampygus]|nr:hypothetical protein INR49_001581 [Caranx melampygus]
MSWEIWQKLQPHLNNLPVTDLQYKFIGDQRWRLCEMKDMEVDLGGFLNQNFTYDYTEDYESPDDLMPEASKAVWIPVVYSVVLVVGLLGNALLLAVLAQKRQSWSISDTFILNLGFADFFLLLTLPLWAVQAAHGWIFGQVLCKISGAVFNKPLFAHVTCMLVWFFSLLLTVPDWVFLVEETDATKKVCIHKYSENKKLWSRLRHHVLGYLLPTAAVIICCFRVLLENRSRITQKNRAVRLILPLVVVFFLCWTPFNITLLVDTSKNPDDSSGNPQGALKTALMVTTVLGCIHTCLRPLLYLGLCLNFRNHSLDVLRCARHESKSSLWELGFESFRFISCTSDLFMTQIAIELEVSTESDQTEPRLLLATE